MIEIESFQTLKRRYDSVLPLIATSLDFMVTFEVVVYLKFVTLPCGDTTMLKHGLHKAALCIDDHRI